MTDGTQELDEILTRFRNGTINPDPRKWAMDEADLHHAKQAILQWVSDEVIGEYEDLNSHIFSPVTLELIRDNMRTKQRNLLKQHGWKEAQDRVERVIEAERNKLKDSK